VHEDVRSRLFTNKISGGQSFGTGQESRPDVLGSSAADDPPECADQDQPDN